jgi:hypothetical protein
MSSNFLPSMIYQVDNDAIKVPFEPGDHDGSSCMIHNFFRTHMPQHTKAPARKTRYSQHNTHYGTHMTTIFGGRFEGKDARKSEEDGVQGASLGIEGERNALCWA